VIDRLGHADLPWPLCPADPGHRRLEQNVYIR
jgi:hypothetical protein